MLQTVLDWKLCAYCSNDLPTQCDTVIWFPCLADQCLNYARLLYMQSIIFTTTIVSDYKAGINHFYLQRIWNPMQMQFMSKFPLLTCFGFIDGTVRPIVDPVLIKELFTMVINRYMPSNFRVYVFRMV